MRRRTIMTFFLALLVALLLFGCVTQLEGAQSQKDIEFLLKKAHSISLSEEGVNRLQVGEICSFRGDEKQSIPYRWRYYISDENVMGIFDNSYKIAPGSRPVSGGDKGWRLFYFEALSPGECVITIRYEDIRDGDYLENESYTYTIVVTDK